MDAHELAQAFTPSRTSSTPLYLQLSSFLALQAKTGGLAPGDRMPPEEEVCSVLNLSRSTVRQAINQLVEQGLLVRYRGKGTFVQETTHLSRELNHLYNFSSDMESAGVTPSSLTRAQEVIDVAGSQVQGRLELTGTTCEVFHLTRVRKANGTPILYEDTYIPHVLCADIESMDFEGGSLYAALRDTCGIEPHAAVETLQAVVLPDDVAPLLDCAKGAIGYRIERVARLETNVVYEYTESYTRADLVTYRFQMGTSKQDDAGSSMIVTPANA